MAKQTKVMIKRKKFLNVEIPIIKSSIEIIGDSLEEVKDRTIKLDLTRQLKGKSAEVTSKIKIKGNKAIAYPIKLNLMPYFIRRMIRKKISYVEDSFETPSQESMIKIKPFLITRKRVSRVVRKTLRNKCKNWIEDYVAERTNDEIFNDILSNKLQKILSLTLKKTYPLSLCEIRILEIKRELKPEEVPEIKEKIKEEIKEGIDQFAEIEDEKKKRAEQEIKKTQEKAEKIEESSQKEIKEKKPEKDKEKKEEIKKIEKETKKPKSKEKTKKKTTEKSKDKKK